MTARPTILLIDDEERILRTLALLFRLQYRVLTTTDPREALHLVETERVHVIVSDQRMPVMRGAELLREVRQRSPNTMRILLTGFSELDAIIASVNEGEIFRYVNKPWDSVELKATVEQAARIAAGLFDAAPAPPAAMPAGVARETLLPAGQPATAEASVLVIDDDAHVAEAVREVATEVRNVVWARNLEQAFGVLQRQPVGVIVSDLSVGGESLTTTLKLLKAEYPEVVTVVMTPFQDAGVLIGLINQGQIYRLLPKPVRKGPLGMNIASALRHHRALKARPAMRSRHAVELPRRPEEMTMVVRVRGLLSRLRERTAGA